MEAGGVGSEHRGEALLVLRLAYDLERADGILLGAGAENSKGMLEGVVGFSQPAVALRQRIAARGVPATRPSLGAGGTFRPPAIALSERVRIAQS